MASVKAEKWKLCQIWIRCISWWGDAAGALYTVNIGGDSELVTSGPENSSEKEMFSVLVGRWFRAVD